MTWLALTWISLLQFIISIFELFVAAQHIEMGDKAQFGWMPTISPFSEKSHVNQWEAFFFSSIRRCYDFLMQPIKVDVILLALELCYSWVSQLWHSKQICLPSLINLKQVLKSMHLYWPLQKVKLQNWTGQKLRLISQ